MDAKFEQIYITLRQLYFIILAYYYMRDIMFSFHNRNTHLFMESYKGLT